MRLRAMAARKIWADSFAIVLCEKDFSGKVTAYAQRPLLTKREDHAPIEPTLELPVDTAQELMDELWRCGLRPTEGSGSAGSLAATERHLADMRALVFKLDVPK